MVPEQSCGWRRLRKILLGQPSEAMRCSAFPRSCRSSRKAELWFALPGKHVEEGLIPAVPQPLLSEKGAGYNENSWCCWTVLCTMPALGSFRQIPLLNPHSHLVATVTGEGSCRVAAETWLAGFRTKLFTFGDLCWNLDGMNAIPKQLGCFLTGCEEDS